MGMEKLRPRRTGAQREVEALARHNIKPPHPAPVNTQCGADRVSLSPSDRERVGGEGFGVREASISETSKTRALLVNPDRILEQAGCKIISISPPHPSPWTGCLVCTGSPSPRPTVRGLGAKVLVVAEHP